MSSPSKKSCENCLNFSFGHDCTGTVKHEACSDWKPKEKGGILSEENSELAAIPKNAAEGKQTPSKSAEEQKGDWLSEIKVKYDKLDWECDWTDEKWKQMFSDIRKGHEAAIQRHIDVEKMLNERLIACHASMEKDASDLEAARKENDILKQFSDLSQKDISGIMAKLKDGERK